MNKYIISTESGSDLSQELIERYNIKVIPMHVAIGEENYPDGSLGPKDVFNYYNETGHLPKTSGTTPQDCMKAFDEIRLESPDAIIIHIAYSAVTTVSYNSTKIAMECYQNIYLVDSKHLTISASAVIIATAKYIESHPDVSPEEIIDFVEKTSKKTHLNFMPQTLLYLKAGGRVSSLAYHGANLLSLCPTIMLNDGYLVSGKKYRGPFKRCCKKMIVDFFKKYDINPSTVLIGGTPEIEACFKESLCELLRSYGVETIKWMHSGAVIASHAGPGTIAITGIEK